MQKHYAYFSAAIRDGAKLRPQTTMRMFGNQRSCALGAGAEACGYDYVEMDYDRDFDTASVRSLNVSNFLRETFPYLENKGARCPVAECDRVEAVDNVIWHLNDSHQWTREAIADWLYAEEEKLGFVTVVETQDYCDTRDNNVTKDSQASLPEEVFI